MQGGDNLDRTGINGVGSKNLGAKLGEYESVTKRGAPKLDVKELELEQHPTSQELVQEPYTSLSEHENIMQEGLPEHEQEMQGASSHPERETHTMLSNPEVKPHKIIATLTG